MSKNPSESIARRLHLEVRHTQRGDDAVATALRGAEHHKDHLVFGVLDDFSQLGFELCLLPRIEVALEDGELEVVAVVLADLEHPAQAFGVGDVVANQIGDAHGPLSPKSKV